MPSRRVSARSTPAAGKIATPMPRCTRSIVLVLIGTGLTLPGCDDRQGRDVPTPPPEPDGSFGSAPTTNAVAEGYAAPYSDGSTYAPGYHSGIGWMGGTMFNNRPGVVRSAPWWTPSYAGARGRSSFFGGSHSSVASHSSSGDGSHTSFGGFGEHASSSHVSA